MKIRAKTRRVQLERETHTCNPHAEADLDASKIAEKL
jgi:hypothetical protein